MAKVWASYISSYGYLDKQVITSSQLPKIRIPETVVNPRLPAHAKVYGPRPIQQVLLAVLKSVQSSHMLDM